MAGPYSITEQICTYTESFSQVTADEQSPSKETPIGGLAGALASALAQRSKHIQSSGRFLFVFPVITI